MNVWFYLTGLLSEMKVAVPWGHIALKAQGSQKNLPVLCLHGWMDNANSFDRLIPLLLKGGAVGCRSIEGQKCLCRPLLFLLSLLQTSIMWPWILGVMGSPPIIALVYLITTKTL